MGEWNHTKPFSARPRRGRIPTVVALATVLVGAAAVLVYVTLPPAPASAQIGVRQNPSPASNAQPSTRAPSPGYVAKVNGEPISYSALAEACVKRYGQEVLETLINKRIVEQACQARSIRITQAEVEAELQTIAQQSGLNREQLIELYRQERDVPPDELVAEILWPRLALKRLAGDSVRITEEEMKQAFEGNFGERVKARMIMVNDERRARELWEKAKGAMDAGRPEEFERLAMNFSEDPVSRPLGGMVQPIRRHSGMPQLEEEAFRLKQGELSKVIQVGPKYVILLCEGRTDPVDVSFDEVRQQLYDDLYEKKIREAVVQVFQQLKADAKIENYLAPEPAGTARAAPSAVRPGASSPVRPASAQRPGESHSSGAPRFVPDRTRR